jgi:hypothetical protein
LNEGGNFVSTPDKAALDSLASTGLLIQYAAQNISDREQKAILVAVIEDIEKSREAAELGQWSPEIATKFWAAYNNLCSLISPVSAETLATSRTPIVYKSRFGNTLSEMSLPQRTVRRYVVLLILLLSSSMGLSFVTSSITTTNAEVKDLIKTADPLADEASVSLTALRAKSIDENDDYTHSKDEGVQKEVAKLTSDLAKLYSAGDQLHDKAGVETLVVFKPYPLCNGEDPNSNYCYRQGDGGVAKTISDAQSNLDDYRLTSRRSLGRADSALDRANFLKSTILPFLFGMTGACAYVVRLMADQIRTSSFSSTSPIRHFVRVMLGALAGVAIGFGGIAGENSVSAAALSFLAGYAIEPVFATFDSIAKKF